MSEYSSVTVVSVTYNSSGVIKTMLSSIPPGVRTIIVDNESRDVENLEKICSDFGATLIRNDHNKGFGTACNQGAHATSTPFIFFLNPDATLEDGAIEALLAAAEKYPNAVAFNPRFTTSDGRSFFKRSSRLMPRNEKMPRKCPETDKLVTVLSGAALLVRASDFHALGGFDENIFLYHEDDDLSRRLLKQRGNLLFVSGARVRHTGGASTEDSPQVAAFKARHIARSRVYATRKHGRPFPLAAAAFSAVKNMLAADMLFSSRRRAKNVAYLLGVLSCLKDGGQGKGNS